MSIFWCFAYSAPINAAEGVLDLAQMKTLLKERIEALSEIQLAIRGVGAYLGSSDLMLPDWVKYAQSTSPSITIMYCNGIYYASPDIKGAILIRLFPEDHNLAFRGEELCGYCTGGSIFLTNENGERVIAGGSNCDRLFN